MRCLFVGAFFPFFCPAAGASSLDQIGVTLLRATTNLDGSGVIIADAEGSVSSNDWEVTPSNSQINLPVSDFTWYESAAPVTNSPNAIGTDSWHSDWVGGLFYGLPGGVSTNAAHILNIQADYFFGVAVPSLTYFPAAVVNQSFAADAVSQTSSDSAYDDYAEQYNTLFVTSTGNTAWPYPPFATVLPPSTSYNGIGVGAYIAAGDTLGSTRVGPTADNGRAKPDLVASGATGSANVTSFAAPLVSGAATLLVQAGLRGDGGPDTNAARDIRTLKALLLNGAVKPAGWSNPAPSPLDPLYGAGVLNVFNSHHQLIGGKQAFNSGTISATNTPHPPLSGPHGYVPVLSGWDFNSISSTTFFDEVNHYCFNVSNSTSYGPYTATATLVWDRQFGQTGINNLDLFLYDLDNSNLVAASTSAVDNVEHVYVPRLPPGRYDLEVVKYGGSMVTGAEVYSLAFDFSCVPLAATPVAGGLKLTWPLYPAGFQLESSTNPAFPGSWVSNTPALLPVLTNNQNSVTIPSPPGPLFFRLIRSP